jgi:hypothetical protein
MAKESDSIQNAGDGQLDGFMTTLQAIFAESADYTKKSVESRLVLGRKTARRQVVRHRDSTLSMRKGRSFRAD